MKRHIKKHLKKLKREKEKRQEKLASLKVNKFFPAIYCLQEKQFIAYSSFTVKPKWKPVVTREHWSDQFANYRSEKYKIDWSKYDTGDVVRCPCCNSMVDFRLWMSYKTPTFYEVKNVEEVNFKELPDSQKPEV